MRTAIVLLQGAKDRAALAVALMSAPLAAVGGAALLHGIYFCDRAARCLVGLIPY